MSKTLAIPMVHIVDQVELEALPKGSIVLDLFDVAWRKANNERELSNGHKFHSWWWSAGGAEQAIRTMDFVSFPMQLVYVGRG